MNRGITLLVVVVLLCLHVLSTWWYLVKGTKAKVFDRIDVICL